MGEGGAELDGDHAGADPGPGGEGRQGKDFFFEKKKQKTFSPGRQRTPGLAARAGSKSFLVLFFKKEHLALPAAKRPAQWRAKPTHEILKHMTKFVTCRAAAALALAAGPLAGCGFDRYDGRWVANVPPSANCCPSRVVMDVDGHKFQGAVENCDGVTAMEGHVDAQGQATAHMQGKTSAVTFSALNFSGPVPGDRCGRQMVGNRGG